MRGTGPYHATPPAAIYRRNRTTLAVFVHFRKCVGTSVRSLFERAAHWLLLPFCMPLPTSVTRGLRVAPDARFVFLELHCTTYAPHFSGAMQRSRKLIERADANAAGRTAVDVWAFTVLRNPVDTTLSEHKYFAGPSRSGRGASLGHIAWVRAHAEDFLFSKRYLRLPRPPGLHCANAAQPCVNESACATLEAAALQVMAPFQHIAFAEDPFTFEPIRQFAAAPENAAVSEDRSDEGDRKVTKSARLPHKNRFCGYCHGDPSPATSGRPIGGSVRHPTAQRVLRWGNESTTVGELRKLATLHNHCSIRVYEALRRRALRVQRRNEFVRT